VNLTDMADDPVVVGDATQLHQVIVNLVTNAAQAMAGQGTIDIGVDAVDMPAARRLSHGNLAAGRYIRLSVADSGHGMDAATLEHIFEPFFTTKPTGSGTGLGLATVHGIVADHGGAIDVESAPGRGSRFDVYLPRSDAAPKLDAAPESPVPRGDGQAILVVDDEEPLVRLTEEMLAALGYEPIGFDDGEQALAACRADPRRFDLVLTDEMMPGTRGTELARELHRMRPDLPVLLMTGQAGGTSARRLQEAGIAELLRKPLLSADLARAVARHLQRTPQSAGGAGRRRR
jgi:CheY-like chemotaxis protein